MNRVILLLLAAGAVAIFLLSPRGWSLTNMPRIEALATLPETDKVEAALDGAEVTMVLPYLPGEAQARSTAALSRSQAAAWASPIARSAS